MRDMFEILEKLSENNLGFCLQSQGKHNYYNLAVIDSKGRHHYFHYDNVEDIEKRLKLLWGHLLNSPSPKFPLPN